jgi:ABC-2 type transport system ATP-binding protein
MTDCIVEVSGLSRQFGKMQALHDLNLQLQPGLVYGLVGANGAGKTTLIKHLLGLLKAQQGSVRVFGLDPVKYPVEVLSRIGYLSEDRDLPEWMSVSEFVHFTAGYYPTWDHAYATELIATFGLNTDKKIKQLSKGMRAQVGLVAAVGHRPDLLLLDEPSTGLDAIVRKDILNAIIRTVADDGRTVVFSSHLLDEVEMMSDHVLMIHQGNLVLQGELDAIRQQHQLMIVHSDTQNLEPWAIKGVLSAQRSGNEWTIVSNGRSEVVRQTLVGLGCEICRVRAANLQEIFLARVGRSRQPENA